MGLSKTRAPERLSKSLLLLWSRVNPVAVGAFDFHAAIVHSGAHHVSTNTEQRFLPSLKEWVSTLKS